MKKLDVVFILDESGSMWNLTKDTIGGYNSLLQEIQKQDAEIYVTTVLFHTEVEVIHFRTPVREVSPMTEEIYKAEGCTALYDAIGTTVVKMDQAYIDEEEHKTLVYITTDGMENSSQEFNSKMIHHMIRQHEKKENYEFKFLAANIDVQAVGEEIGIQRKNRVSILPTAKGIQKCYMTMCDSVMEEIKK